MTAPVDVSAPNTPEDPANNTSKYPYSPLLQQLESKAYQSLSSPESSPWDLSHDALLATLLHEFSNHIVRRTREVSMEVRKLQSSVNKVGVDVALVQNEWMKSNRCIFIEQVVKEDVDGDQGNKRDNKVQKEEKMIDTVVEEDDDSAAEIARLEAEEQSAIHHGMKALSIFFDHKQSKENSEHDHDDLGFDDDVNVDDDVIGDNCYYYPSAGEDAFNQRPLPFIVGSREFMESSCAGLGVEKEGNEN